ncbi:phosphonopyruvate decarboxylase [Phascolarctobacterium sp.]
MNVEKIVELIGSDFYAGVPDSQLKPFCDYLMNNYGIDPAHHIIGANEGSCVALAAGYHLATGKIPVVYMQNSGEGNIINPVASLLSDKVYAIPVVFIIGWRGEPGIHDEPQHIYQGEVTIKLLEDMDIATFIITKETTEEEVKSAMEFFYIELSKGKSVAFVVRKGSITYDANTEYSNKNKMIREEIIRHIVRFTGNDPIISTTGKASRELFEIRTENGQSHKYDFLTVGSMGHSSSIALGVALHKPTTKVWCIDGDGAVLMHMGTLAVIGSNKPKNMVHIVINNGAHETVGGMPTVAGDIDFVGIAKSCGYHYATCVDRIEDLDTALKVVKEKEELSLIEVKCSLGARANLGRPTNTAIENKRNFMKHLSDY